MDGSHIHHRFTARVVRAADVHRVSKEWGEEQWIVNRDYCGKKLLLRRNRRCSLHSHRQKDEVFYIAAGKVLMEVAGEEYTLEPGDFIHIRPGDDHRFTGLEDSEIIEFSTHHREDDSYRREFSGHAEPQRYERQKKLMDRFSALNILVIGEAMLDRYVQGRIDRISPEAPVPVVRMQKEWEVLGGAGNSAANLAALGARVSLISLTGKDDAAKRLTRLLKKQRIRATLLVDPQRLTILKERVVSHDGQQIVRVDREEAVLLLSSLERQLTAAIEAAASGVDAILVSDYAKGLLSVAILKRVIALGKKRKIPVVIDPKPRAGLTAEDLSGASLLTPNGEEARKLLGNHVGKADQMGPMLSGIVGPVLLTRGADGIDLCKKGACVVHVDSLAPDVVDVSGAGDTVAAVATLVLAAGGSLEDAADMGNRAASVVVGKQGTATVNTDELERAL